jgi:hypothetical protein
LNFQTICVPYECRLTTVCTGKYAERLSAVEASLATSYTGSYFSTVGGCPFAMLSLPCESATGVPRGIAA